MQQCSCSGVRVSATPVTVTAPSHASRLVSQPASRPKRAAGPAAVSGRRQLLLGGGGVLIGLSGHQTPSSAYEIDLESQLPSVPSSQSAELPRAYRQTVTKLASSLRDSLDAEASGAEEFEVRRKADPVKEHVRAFVGKWRDDPRVSSDATHAEITAVLSELGAFYQKNGPRSRLSKAVRESVLAHLDRAEAALPKEAGGGSIVGSFGQ